MTRCFVIQPFDGDAFDKRFDDVIKPAIKTAGLEAYRVDRDPTVTVPIEAIETGIRDSAACLADITTDNPNVWFELGFALACDKPVVLICSALRATKFPFDVQHRTIIRYKTESTSDFDSMRVEIADRLKAIVAKESRVQALAQVSLQATEGLEPHEIAALVLIAESDLDPESFPSAYSLKHNMGQAGFTELAAVLAVKSLRVKGMVEATVVDSQQNESYLGFHLLDAGAEWLIANRNRLVLKKAPKKHMKTQSAHTFDDFPGVAAEDDDLPF
jgi:hypothetical protein